MRGYSRGRGITGLRILGLCRIGCQVVESVVFGVGSLSGVGEVAGGIRVGLLEELLAPDCLGLRDQLGDPNCPRAVSELGGEVGGVSLRAVDELVGLCCA